MQLSGENSRNFSIMQRTDEIDTINYRDSSCINVRKLFAELLQFKFDYQLDGLLKAFLCVIQKHTL